MSRILINVATQIYRPPMVPRETTFWVVDVETTNTTWREIFVRRDDLDAFVRGVRVCAEVAGFFGVRYREKTANGEDV